MNDAAIARGAALQLAYLVRDGRLPLQQDLEVCLEVLQAGAGGSVLAGVVAVLLHRRGRAEEAAIWMESEEHGSEFEAALAFHRRGSVLLSHSCGRPRTCIVRLVEGRA